MRVLRRIGLVLPCLVAAAQVASAQVEAPTFTNVPYTKDTGWVSSSPAARGANDLELVTSFIVEQKGADWMRLYFDDVVLAGDPLAGTGAELRILALVDGGYQVMNAIEVDRWQRSTAYFNGDTVVVEVWARPGSGASRVVLDTIDIGVPPLDPGRSICGNADDRLPSTDPRSARLLPVGCTAWLITDCAGCFLTAGHCTGNISVVQFNVPPSTSSGSIQNPPPQDQYPVDGSSLQSNGGQGVGNDWATFGTFPNGTTGMSASMVQGPGFTLVSPPSVGNANIRITGYGTDNSPPQRNQVQQTHVGPLVTNSGTTVQYRTDTTGGNSGSPVIWDQMDQAVGIHTHGGCTSGGGQNSGTSISHPALQNALSSPRGVCAGGIAVPSPPQLIPLGQVTNVVATALGPVVQGTMTLHVRPDAASMFQSFAMTDIGSGLFSAPLPMFDCGDEPEFYVSAQSTTCGQVFAPEGGMSAPFEAEIGSIVPTFADDFETDTGWTTAVFGASSGQWQRGVPVNDPGWNWDPSSDGDGSGQCYVTQNQNGNTDVDNGTVQLTSPSTLVTDPETRVDYLYYLAMSREGMEDALVVQVSANDGQSWTQVRRHDISTSGGWSTDVITPQELAAAGVVPGSQLRVRFRANDGNSQSFVEAGVDGFSVGVLGCDPLAIGTVECAPAIPNSSGLSATLRARGSEVVSDNDVTLYAERLPANASGYFLVSRDAGFIANPGGSAGNLCLGGEIGRYAGNVLGSGAAGEFQMVVDLTSVPQPTGAIAVVPGDTFRFQAWFRDFTIVPTSNFTHGLAITFQ